jgi:outer membrane receptor protein involved in Fe transport
MSAYAWGQTSPPPNGSAAAPTGAAAASTTAAPNTNSLAEVEVTATRTVEAESKVPISLAVYDNAELNIRGFRDATDMMLMTPGITYSNSGFLGSNSISIRGIASGSGQSTVGIYLDDTPMQVVSLGFDSTSVFPKLFDLDRVEVLRGPQGTLFGASSEGGTIRFITPDPSLSQWSTYDRAEVGKIYHGGWSYDLGAAGGGPLIDDKLGIRVSAYYRRDGGWIDRYNLLSDELLSHNSNYADSYVLRFSMRWAATENLQITPSFFYQRVNQNDQTAYFTYVSNPGQAQFKSVDPLQSPVDAYFYVPALKIAYTNPYFQIFSNTSYYFRDDHPVADYTLVDTGIFAGDGICCNIPNYRAFSQFFDGFQTLVEDLRITSDPNARLRWTFGLYASNARQNADEKITDQDFAQLIYFLYGGSLAQITGVPLLDNRYIYLQYFYAKNREVATYGELSYEIVHGLRFTAGVRLTRNELWNSNYVTGAFNFGTNQGIVSSTEHAVTPKYNISWQINDGSMVYATMDKGFRPGGGNVSINNAACLPELHTLGFASAPLTYNSDNLWNYEVGTKNRILNNSAEISGSAFYVTWNGIQQNQYLVDCGLQFTANLGQAISKGFDFELAQNIGHFQYLLQAGYTDAYFSKNLVLNPSVLPIVRDGSALVENPWTISIGAQYNFTAFQHESFGRVDWASSSGFRPLPANDPTTSSYTPYNMVPTSSSYFNGRLGTNIGPFQVSLFANNMFNAHPVLSGFTEGGNRFFQATTLIPRTIGITAEYRH